MVRVYTDVPKRARNSITCQVQKLVSKYGFKETQLVINKLFQQSKDKERLKEEIARREKELAKLKQKKV